MRSSGLELTRTLLLRPSIRIFSFPPNRFKSCCSMQHILSLAHFNAHISHNCQSHVRSPYAFAHHHWIWGSSSVSLSNSECPELYIIIIMKIKNKKKGNKKVTLLLLNRLTSKLSLALATCFLSTRDSIVVGPEVPLL